MENVSLKIDGIDLNVPSGYTILQAAKEAGIRIPTLCYLKGINEIAACRMCLVEIKGMRALQAACVYPVSNNLEVFTNTEIVRNARKANLDLILSNHDRKCLTCVRNKNCELQSLAEELNIEDIQFSGENTEFLVDDLSPAIVRNNNKCVVCRRCVSVCRDIQTTAVIQAKNRGFNTSIGSIFDKSLNDISCIMCGQCIVACPVGALTEKSHIQRVWDALSNDELHVVVQTAPSVRVALGEEFGMPIGTLVTGKMATALKMMGFDKVFDTNTGADLTIMEEGTELINRITNNGTLPMITSCSPGWVKFCEHYYPEFIDNLSTCKSPHTMLGAILKSYYAAKSGLEPKTIFVVSVMPCTAKKFEIDRPVMEVNGLRDVDAVITTRELGKMLREIGIDFENLPDGTYDNPLGSASGAGTIFGASGGVTEAALRTVAEKLTGRRYEEIEFKNVRGNKGIKEFEVKLDEMTLKGCVVNGTGNARIVLDKVKAGESDYHFIEVMGCPGGCVTGGGQPIVPSKFREDHSVWELRAGSLYKDDENLELRRSHENPFILKLYDEYLDEPNSHKAHKLLHTSYEKREEHCINIFKDQIFR